MLVLSEASSAAAHALCSSSHGHYKGQYTDGFRTPSIIHNENEVHQYDDDYTVILGDWYHDEHEFLITKQFISETNPTGAEPVPKSALMYFAHTAARLGSFAPYLPGFSENATLPFVPGRTYRLRLINMSALAMFHFWIEGHDMRIIEADGVDTREFPTDVLTLSAAQRYSVLVTARNDTSQNWPIHANMDPVMFDVVPEELVLNVTSTLSYREGQPLGSDRPELETYDYFDDTAVSGNAQLLHFAS